MFFLRKRGYRYYYRGDPSFFDFTVGCFIRDNTWRDLDLSSIVPAGTVAVNLAIEMASGVSNKFLGFRKKGNLYSFNCLCERTQVSKFSIYFGGIISCDINRKIQYRAESNEIEVLNVTVCGWVK